MFAITDQANLGQHEYRGVLAYLRERRQTSIHVVDPFKVPLPDAVEKAGELERRGIPAIVLASTDYDRFEDRISSYVAAIKSAVGIPIILHFPPKPGAGFPFALGADAIIYPALLGSRDAYFVWKSYLETVVRLARRSVDPAGIPDELFAAALTFGPDPVSNKVMHLDPIDPRPESLRFYVDVIQRFGFEIIYLYSRYSEVSTDVCRYFRKELGAKPLIFVSGGVRNRQQVARYLAAGADYVPFASALERPDWRPALDRICGRAVPMPTTLRQT